MNLKDYTKSLWEEVSPPTFNTLTEDKTIETCVVGGGITGISIAYQMAKRGHDVALVEAFRLGSGQTGRTTAHLTYQLEEPIRDLLKIHDVETVRTFISAHKKAIDLIESITLTENISCDFKRVDGFYFAGRNFSKEDLLQEKKAAAKVGVDLDLIEVTPNISASVPSLRYPRQGQFHPMKYIAGLARVLKELSVPVFEGTHVNDIKQVANGTWVLTTDTGNTIHCRNLVVATNTPVNNRFHIHTKQYAYRTYALAFELEKPLKEECLLWDTEDPYHYIRFSGNCCIIGGEDHRTGQTPESDPFAELENWSRKNFGFLGAVTSRWSGQVFEPMDQIGFIGRNPGAESNVYISTGESGIGMTSSAIASVLIPDLIDKGDHPWAKVFDPSRPPVKGLRDFVQENVNVALQYADWVTPSEVKRESEIPVHSGSLLREGLSKHCIYHDDGEEFVKKSAVCPHLGGIVHWNEIEKTWDCPCHGSRFNPAGKVIEGPSLKDLSET